MSLPRFKRPSSARRNVKYDSFTQHVSASRLRHLQSLLSENPTDTEPDAILCISGIDSRYCDGMYELMNYLLFGFFDVRKSEFERSGIDNEVIEDLLILVKPDSVEVYCNPVNYLFLLPYISHWRNIRFHCLTDSEYEDEEAAEEYKITSLITMVKGCKKIGIPYSSTRAIHEFDIFALEKWPIIQAFAYEGYEGGGFFTLKHEVVDVSVSVHRIYTLMDPVLIEILTKEHLPLIEKQWHTMMSTVDVELSSHSDALTEGKVCESLKSFYEHGLVGNPKLTDGLVPFPVVVFGTRANRQVMGQAASGEKMEGCIAKSGVKGKPALTMVCQAVAPKYPLTCARTYFFCPVYNPFSEDVPERKSLTDFDCLTVVYQAMVEAVLEAIEVYVTTQRFDQAQAAVLEGVADRCRAVDSPVLQGYLSQRSRVTFRIEALDNVGGCGTEPGLEQRLHLKLATCTLWDVPSLEHPGLTLGALVFAETFQDSVILIENADKSTAISTDYLVLTSHIPRYKQWNATPQDAAARKQIQEELAHREVPGMGGLLSGGESVAVLTSSPVTYPAENANLYAFENGIVVQNPQYGAFPILGSRLAQLAFFDGDSSNTVALLILHLEAEALLMLPHHLKTADQRLILAFLPGSQAHKALYKKILVGWKTEESQMPEVIRAEELPADLATIHEDIQTRFMAEGRSSVLPTQLLYFHSSQLPHSKRFMKHFEVSSVGGEVPRRDLDIALQKQTEAPHKKDGQIVVTVISGMPGSYQENLLGKVKTLGKEHIRWVVLGDLANDTRPWGFSELQELLSQTLSAHRQQLAKPDAKATRVILLNPGFMDTQDIVRAITNHRNMAIGDIFRIGAVTVCVDPKNFFIEHKMPFPGLLNLCAQGWVNTILFTTPPLEENLDLEDIQSMIRGINSNVSLTLADKALITRSPDLEQVLSETAFSHPDMVRARLLLTPSWHKASSRSLCNFFMSVLLQFKSPLDKPRFVSQLKGLKASFKGFPYQGNVYRVQGRARFTGSQQHQKVDFVSMTDHMTTAPVAGDSSNPFFLRFWGYGLEQNKLKDWLRISAPQKPKRRPLLTRQDVTKDQIQKIHKAHHLEPLPEGWFFNGTTFISMGGERSDTHPNLEQFIADYIERRNEDIKKHNASIPPDTGDDMFL